MFCEKGCRCRLPPMGVASPGSSLRIKLSLRDNDNRGSSYPAVNDRFAKAKVPCPAPMSYEPRRELASETKPRPLSTRYTVPRFKLVRNTSWGSLSGKKKLSEYSSVREIAISRRGVTSRRRNRDSRRGLERTVRRIQSNCL